jgi:hypothetical protein
MTVTATSLEAFNSLRDSGKLTVRQQQVMAVISPGRDYSLHEISILCGLPINCVSGRVKELRDADKLEAGPRRACKVTSNKCNPVRLITADGA